MTTATRVRPMASARLLTRHSRRQRHFLRKLDQAADAGASTRQVAIAADYVRGVMTDLSARRQAALASEVVTFLFAAADTAWAAGGGRGE